MEDEFLDMKRSGKRPWTAGSVLLALVCAFWAGMLERGMAESEPPPYQNTNYRICGGDVILVKVFQEPELDSQHRVSRDGSISMALVGKVNVRGKTVADCAGLIGDLLSKGYLKNPQVRVNVIQYAPRRFSILGQVQRPGTYNMPEEMTTNLLEAIAMAGGFSRSADLKQITIRRKGEGEDQVFTINAKNLERNQGVEVFQIAPGDLVMVGEKLF
jgi:polysaccharide export outer membrane protein